MLCHSVLWLKSFHLLSDTHQYTYYNGTAGVATLTRWCAINDYIAYHESARNDVYVRGVVRLWLKVSLEANMGLGCLPKPKVVKNVISLWPASVFCYQKVSWVSKYQHCFTCCTNWSNKRCPRDSLKAWTELNHPPKRTILIWKGSALIVSHWSRTAGFTMARND